MFLLPSNRPIQIDFLRQSFHFDETTALRCRGAALAHHDRELPLRHRSAVILQHLLVNLLGLRIDYIC